MGLWQRATNAVDVLAVCTGNLCRSPIMQTLLAAGAPSLTVVSAGTSAQPREPWHPLAVQALAEAGHEVAGHARRLRARDVQSAALVLTATGIHRARVVQLDPTSEERCFTLLEAARLLAVAPPPPALDPAGLAAHLATALHENPLEHDDDLPDPLTGTIEDFRRCREQVAAAVVPVAAALSSRMI